MPALKTYAVKKRTQVDLSLSGNSFGPSPKVVEALKQYSGQVHLYPFDEESLIRLIAKHHHLPEDSILLGAGANELLEDYLKVLALRKHLVVPAATFPESVSCMKILEGDVDEISLNDDLTINLELMLNAVKSHTAFIHLCNPNNPTGIWTDSAHLVKLADQSPVPLLISEAGADFVGKTLLNQSLHPNVIVVRSFSKAYGLAGLRIGYSVASPEIISTMQKQLRSYRISSLTVVAAIAAIQDQDYLHQSIDWILKEKKWLINAKMLKQTFLWGSFIPALVYILWTSSVLSVVYHENAIFYEQMAQGKVEVGELIKVLSSIAEWPSIQLLIWWISILAIATSVLGVSVGLCEALEGMMPQISRWIKKVVSSTATILPAYLVAIYIPNAFMAALGFAGMILAVIAILLPAYLFRQIKGKELHYPELKVKGLIGLSVASSILVILCEVYNIAIKQI